MIITVNIQLTDTAFLQTVTSLAAAVFAAANFFVDCLTLKKMNN